jgi:hypothetical protein
MTEALIYKYKILGREITEVFIPSESIAFTSEGDVFACNVDDFKEASKPTKTRVDKSLMENLKSYIVMKDVFDKKTEEINETVKSCFSEKGEILLGK